MAVEVVRVLPHPVRLLPERRNDSDAQRGTLIQFPGLLQESRSTGDSTIPWSEYRRIVEDVARAKQDPLGPPSGPSAWRDYVKQRLEELRQQRATIDEMNKKTRDDRTEGEEKRNYQRARKNARARTRYWENKYQSWEPYLEYNSRLASAEASDDGPVTINSSVLLVERDPRVLGEKEPSPPLPTAYRYIKNPSKLLSLSKRRSFATDIGISELTRTALERRALTVLQPVAKDWLPNGEKKIGTARLSFGSNGHNRRLRWEIEPVPYNEPILAKTIRSKPKGFFGRFISKVLDAVGDWAENPRIGSLRLGLNY